MECQSSKQNLDMVIQMENMEQQNVKQVEQKQIEKISNSDRIKSICVPSRVIIIIVKFAIVTTCLSVLIWEAQVNTKIDQ